MAARKKAKRKAKRATTRKRTTRRKGSVADMIISKARTKNAVRKCNVSGDFYGALDEYVRAAIKEAESRAQANGRKTLRPQDL